MAGLQYLVGSLEHVKILLKLPFSLPPTPKYIISHPHKPWAAALPAHGSCPPALIKLPVCANDISRILYWSWLWTPPTESHLYLKTTSPHILESLLFPGLWVEYLRIQVETDDFRASFCSTCPSSPAGPNMLHTPLVPGGLITTSFLPSPWEESCLPAWRGSCWDGAGSPDASLNTKPDWLSLTMGIKIMGTVGTVGRKMTEELYRTNRKFSL